MEYDDINDAKEQVKLGKAWVAVYLGSNFTTDLMARSSSSMDNATINGSTVHLYADVTSEFALRLKCVFLHHCN